MGEQGSCDTENVPGLPFRQGMSHFPPGLWKIPRLWVCQGSGEEDSWGWRPLCLDGVDEGSEEFQREGRGKEGTGKEEESAADQRDFRVSRLIQSTP